MESKKILVGVPSCREDNRFLDSLNNLLKQMHDNYEVTLLIEKWKGLAEAQNNITDYFLSKDFDYLLFLDDDHWGHTIEMVDTLIEANTYMATMKTYVRHYPYPIALFNINEARDYRSKYSGVENGFGYKEVDMTGFPMTLIKRDLFSKLSRPYFVGRDYGGRDWNTDIDFCEKIRSLGIKPVGCYQYCLPHGDITEDNVLEMRIRNMKTMSDRVSMYFNLAK